MDLPSPPVCADGFLLSSLLGAASCENQGGVKVSGDQPSRVLPVSRFVIASYQLLWAFVKTMQDRAEVQPRSQDLARIRIPKAVAPTLCAQGWPVAN